MASFGQKWFGGGAEAITKLVDQIKALQRLEDGWNSHRAPRISELAIKSALEVVDVIARKHAPLPSASPTPLGGVALVWDFKDRDLEVQLLIDQESFDYSVGRRAHPKVVDEGSSTSVSGLERVFIDRYLLHPA
jgi:hypothetical protein